MRILFLLLISTSLSAQCIGDFDKTLLVLDSAGYFKDLTVRYRNSTVSVNVDQTSYVFDITTKEEVCGTQRNTRVHFDEGHMYIWFDEKGLRYLDIRTPKQYIWKRR